VFGIWIHFCAVLLKCYHFCYRSQEWTLIPEHERKNIGLSFSHDGEFWWIHLTHYYYAAFPQWSRIIDCALASVCLSVLCMFICPVLAPTSSSLQYRFTMTSMICCAIWCQETKGSVTSPHEAQAQNVSWLTKERFIMYLKWETASRCLSRWLLACLTGALAALWPQASRYLSGVSGCSIRAIHLTCGAGGRYVDREGQVLQWSIRCKCKCQAEIAFDLQTC